jgi:SAM-dependent methyltransferase
MGDAVRDLADPHAVDAAPPPVERHGHYGPAMPSRQWVPAPRYLMRRDLILTLARDLTPGRLLEIGCGAGALLDDLTRLGFRTVGVDQSLSAYQKARAMLAGNSAAEVRMSCDGLPSGSFDYLAAFEVLEHIEDDAAALSGWARHLKPHGTLLISVPAHPDRWNAADEWAGHYRRYTRASLEALVREAGFEVVTVWSYGFPVANVMERLSAGIYARQTKKRGGDAMSQDDRTQASGTDRSTLTRLWPVYRSGPITLLMRMVWRVQRLFLRSNLGIGYLVLARRA